MIRDRWTGQVCVTAVDHARAGMHPVSVCAIFRLTPRALLAELCLYVGKPVPADSGATHATVAMWRTYFTTLGTMGI